jgi:hypothetical protein
MSLQAQDHVFKGEIDEALEILWELQLKPDLGLYRRALVNLLIACNADIRVHNCSESAEECLELLLQLQRDGYPPKEGTLLTEKHAREALKAIEMEEVELQKAEEKLVDQAEAATSALKNLRLGEQSDTEDGMDSSDDHDHELSQIPGSRAKPTSIIRGMYTDYYGQKGKDENAGKARKTSGCTISHTFLGFDARREGLAQQKGALESPLSEEVLLCRDHWAFLLYAGAGHGCYPLTNINGYT